MECRHKLTMCRLCLCESECFIDIFQVNECFGYGTSEVITDLLQLQVSDKDIYPDVVCSICLGKLTDFKQFKEQCQNCRDTYNNLFASDESHDEHPVDIVPSGTIKREVEEETNDVDATTEVRECSTDFTAPEYLARHRKEMCRESYGPFEHSGNGVIDVGKSLLKRRKMVIDDADPRENINSSGSSTVKVGKMDVEVRRDCNSPDERIHMFPAEEGGLNGEEISVGELSIETIKREEEAYSVGASVAATRGDVIIAKSKVGSENETTGGRERGEEAPLGVEEREIKRKRFRCHDCGEDLEERDELIRHLQLHGYQVNGESGSGGGDLQVNANNNRGSKSKTSDSLEKRLTRKASDEVKGIEGVRKYVCDFCDKGFVRIGHLEAHLMVHSGKKPFPCTICDKRFSVKSSLRKHKLIHTGKKPHACDICGSQFNRIGNLNTHRRYHTGEKPYVCQVCGLRFVQKGDLLRHRGVHSDEKPYACQVCGIRVSRKDNLKSHMIVHTDERPFACEICGIRFSRKSNLTSHVRACNGKKPYGCKTCGKRYRHQCYLMKHMKVYHKGKNLA